VLIQNVDNKEIYKEGDCVLLVCIKCYKKCDLYTHKVIPRPQVNRPMLTSPQTSNANS